MKKYFLILFLSSLFAFDAGCSSSENKSADIRCGDGVCSFGERCLNCPKDCDCETNAATPIMGWNSWNKFACEIDEDMIKEMADALVSSGMRDAGYVYLNMDDCWQTSRDEKGKIVADPVKFKGGIKALADYVHSKGLKFGLYTCAGTMTCQKRPGSFDYDEEDAATYAEWGIDYVKEDYCFVSDERNSHELYKRMRDAIDKTGRNIILSICNWGVQEPWVWGPLVGELWRTTGDIADDPLRMKLNYEPNEKLAAYASIGHWNDPDMLEVGNGAMSENSYKSHMSLWAVMAAPLIAGHDARSMTKQTADILLNSEIIDVDQDPWGIQGRRIKQTGKAEVWVKPIAKLGARAVALFNASFDYPELYWEGKEETISVKWEELGLKAGKAKLRDLWAHEDMGEFIDGYETLVLPESVKMLIVEGTEYEPGAGETELSALKPMYYAVAAGEMSANKACSTTNAAPGKIAINGKSFDKGTSVCGASAALYNLGKKCASFEAQIGVDDSAGTKGTVVFEVWADNKKIFSSGIVKAGDAAKKISVDLTGKQMMKLVVNNAGDTIEGDVADWAEAKVVCK